MSHYSSLGFEVLPLRDPISQTFTKTQYRQPIKVSQFHSPPTPKLPLFNEHIQTTRRQRRIDLDSVLSEKPLLLGILQKRSHCVPCVFGSSSNDPKISHFSLELMAPRA